MRRGRRDRILDALRNSAEARSITGLAGEIGVHPNTIRFHLDTLVKAGLVEQVADRVAVRGRPPARYRACRRMDPAGPTNYALLAAVMTDYFAAHARDPVRESTQLGRSWGTTLTKHHARDTRQAVDDLVDVLAEVGFGPEQPTERTVRDIRLRHCPFLEVVDRHQPVVCALHLGLMQGALTAMQAPLAVERLDPFVEPDLCVARVGPAAGNDEN
ncbi:helix-turn-helix transcriptional regulator [Mycolicibacterium holsaticum]|uniref:helix-turn-helix transcriptional regulator n=1 Tax=Mycolicibacterium holsaticum TaxID=152142 RepID=UPI001C7D3299|nr:helix-turn-helix domain-containing protein [Mycolicibacterium holsaticum]MDA4110405.1 transcriptional regulator [Mycolicibacterium holsaticum DSM 44478 = JCM 12374]QZA11018.1 helix-turn-helix domain-containing protein [Mycolicibacterium holsaticum DSM 44478 = JCM 12374]UNC11487.1 helix-turn-helix domain-containing protein [Mycolicibacterium holsaticum DSM 44478 = JCM 12374]